MAEQTRTRGWAVGAGVWRLRSHWVLTLYPDAREASGVWRKPRASGPAGAGMYESDEDRSAAEAARRAQGKIRRNCAANELNRLGTLTYAGEGQHDPEALRLEVGEFFRRLRRGIKVRHLPMKRGVAPDRPFPYLWVPQWHPGGHGLHVHFAVARYIARRVIESSWPHGFVHIKLLSDLSTRSGPLEEARLASRYLARYVGEQLDDERRRLGLHRYEVAQGYQPVEEKLHGRTIDEVIEAASERLGKRPRRVWRSEGTEGWHGPPACWAQWPS
jgi:hypothetical protein